MFIRVLLVGRIYWLMWLRILFICWMIVILILMRRWSLKGCVRWWCSRFVRMRCWSSILISLILRLCCWLRIRLCWMRLLSISIIMVVIWGCCWWIVLCWVLISLIWRYWIRGWGRSWSCISSCFLCCRCSCSIWLGCLSGWGRWGWWRRSVRGLSCWWWVCLGMCRRGGRSIIFWSLLGGWLGRRWMFVIVCRIILGVIFFGWSCCRIILDCCGIGSICGICLVFWFVIILLRIWSWIWRVILCRFIGLLLIMKSWGLVGWVVVFWIFFESLWLRIWRLNKFLLIICVIWGRFVISFCLCWRICCWGCCMGFGLFVSRFLRCWGRGFRGRIWLGCWMWWWIGCGSFICNLCWWCWRMLVWLRSSLVCFRRGIWVRWLRCLVRWFWGGSLVGIMFIFSCWMCLLWRVLSGWWGWWRCWLWCWMWRGCLILMSIMIFMWRISWCCILRWWIFLWFIIWLCWSWFIFVWIGMICFGRLCKIWEVLSIMRVRWWLLGWLIFKCFWCLSCMMWWILMWKLRCCLWRLRGVFCILFVFKLVLILWRFWWSLLCRMMSISGRCCWGMIFLMGVILRVCIWMWIWLMLCVWVIMSWRGWCWRMWWGWSRLGGYWGIIIIRIFWMWLFWILGWRVGGGCRGRGSWRGWGWCWVICMRRWGIWSSRGSYMMIILSKLWLCCRIRKGMFFFFFIWCWYIS